MQNISWDGRNSNFFLFSFFPFFLSSFFLRFICQDLFMKRYENNVEELNRSRWALNVLMDKVETVCPYLVKAILNNKRGGDVVWLSSFHIFFRFFSSLFYKRTLIEEYEKEMQLKLTSQKKN